MMLRNAVTFPNKSRRTPSQIDPDLSSSGFTKLSIPGSLAN